MILDELIREAEAIPPSELPAFRGALAQADSIALMRLTTVMPPTPAATEPDWLTPQEAADVAKVSVKRLYELARRKPWTKKLTKRCLRIDGPAFRKWLASRT